MARLSFGAFTSPPPNGLLGDMSLSQCRWDVGRGCFEAFLMTTLAAKDSG